MSILFDGDDVVDLGTGTLVGNDWTISTWFKSPDVSTFGELFSLTGGVGNRIDISKTGSTIRCAIFNQFGSERKRYFGNTILSNNTWYNYIATWAGSLGDILELYLNGIKDTPYSKFIDESGTMTDTSRIRKIGDDGGATNFVGQITEVAVWNKTLTAPEVLSVFNSKNKGKPLDVQVANLVGFWRMDDGQDGSSADGETIADSSGNGIHGTGNNGVNNTGLIWKAEEALTQSSLIHRKYW